VRKRLLTVIGKRGVLPLAISAISALLAAKTGGGFHTFGFWDGPI
jgi:hypothetical protein